MGSDVKRKNSCKINNLRKPQIGVKTLIESTTYDSPYKASSTVIGGLGLGEG
jgi:hypothetical protein